MCAELQNQKQVVLWQQGLKMLKEDYTQIQGK